MPFISACPRFVRVVISCMGPQQVFLSNKRGELGCEKKLPKLRLAAMTGLGGEGGRASLAVWSNLLLSIEPPPEFQNFI